MIIFFRNYEIDTNIIWILCSTTIFGKDKLRFGSTMGWILARQDRNSDGKGK